MPPEDRETGTVMRMGSAGIDHLSNRLKEEAYHYIIANTNVDRLTAMAAARQAAAKFAQEMKAQLRSHDVEVWG